MHVHPDAARSRSRCAGFLLCLGLCVAVLCLPAQALCQDDGGAEGGETADSDDACGLLPAEPSRIQARAPDPELAFTMSEKAYAAYEAKDCHCTAWYNLETYRAQPDPIIVLNVAAALERCGDLDAALRYARHALTLELPEADVEAAQELVKKLTPILADPDAYVSVSLADYDDAERIELDHVFYETGDAPNLLRGEQTVDVKRGGKKTTETIEVPPPPKKQEPVEPPEPEFQPTTLFWTGVGAAGGGVVMLIATLAIDAVVTPKRDEYDALGDCLREQCPDPSGSVADYNALGEEIDGLVTAELGLLITGSILTAAGIGILSYALFATDSPSAIVGGPASPGDVQLGGTLTPRGGSLELQVRF